MEMMTGFAPRLPTDIFLCAPGTLLDLAERELVELPLRLRQVHDLALETSEIYDRHRYSAEFRNHHSVNFETDSYVMLKVPAFAKTLAARRAKGLATRLLLQWSGPHKVVRMIGTNNCEIIDRDDNKPYIVNVARLVPYRHFQPSRSAVDIAIRAALPQPAAAEPESKEEQQAPLFVATPSPAEIAVIGNPSLSLGPSPAAVAYIESLEARRKRFLNYQLQKFRDRLGIPAEASEPAYESIQDLELRLRDLATFTSRAVEYNRYYDSLLLSRDYPGESPLHVSTAGSLSVIALAPLSTGPASAEPAPAYPDLQSYWSTYTPLSPSAPQPTLSELLHPDRYSAEPLPASADDLTSFRCSTDYSRLANEPRVQSSFLPTTTGITRGLSGRASQPHHWLWD